MIEVDVIEDICKSVFQQVICPPVDQGDDVNELPSRREVINLVDDSDDDAPPVLWLQNHEPKCTKQCCRRGKWRSWSITENLSPFNRRWCTVWNGGDSPHLTFSGSAGCSATNTTGCSRR
jgi:hypothetical protein